VAAPASTVWSSQHLSPPPEFVDEAQSPSAIQSVTVARRAEHTMPEPRRTCRRMR